LSPSRSLRRAAFFVVAVSVFAVGHSPGSEATRTSSIPPTTQVRKAGTPLVGWSTVAADRWPTRTKAVIAKPLATSVTVYSKPSYKSSGVTLTAGQTVVGKIGLLVTDISGDWLQVLLPARPNGLVGWIHSKTVKLSVNQQTIVIELSTNTLTYFDGDKIVFERKVSTGTGNTPTPTGLFAVKEVVPQKDKNTVVGPVAIGITGFSEVLQEYAGGQGTVAIHGTNSPGKLGQRVSHGCIRLPNADIVLLAAKVPLGTPVEIVNKLSDLPKTRWTHPNA
jgi:lipoprotein-anchoring transpeptidase ErfK/SrfK